jgi:predicted aldo/keto reductase-like oxidoreductase
MLYKQFHDLSLSLLGMGNMRLPKLEGKGEAIDEEKARLIVEQAYNRGINYFDTAYRYHGGESERFAGKVLSQFPRGSFYLATKMPGHMMIFKDGKYSFTGMLAHALGRTPAEVFEEQLEKCRVNYFDFYLLHNICETSYDFYTNEETGIVSLLLEEKKKGRIRHLGFSAHGRPETIERFLDWSASRFPAGCFEFAQIQLNYLDWILQNAKRKYEILTERGLPVVVMEPCRGGRLASFDESITAHFKKVRPHDSVSSWAFRFVKSLPNVQVVLSGMSSLDQLEDNLKTFSDPVLLSGAEHAIIQEVTASLVNLVPCTSCRYCCEECPQKLDIPKFISICNEVKNGGDSVWGLLRFTLDAMKEEELPANCISCGNCKQVCPQGIEIPGIMKELAEGMAAHKK